jgi:hypothetical protein
VVVIPFLNKSFDQRSQNVYNNYSALIAITNIPGDDCLSERLIVFCFLFPDEECQGCITSMSSLSVVVFVSTVASSLQFIHSHFVVSNLGDAPARHPDYPSLFRSGSEEDGGAPSQ